MKIIPLSEGSFTIDKTKQFVPFNVEADDLQQRPAGSLLVEVQPFAVITNNDVLVIDTGLGFVRNGQLQLHENLRANNIEPSSVTKVLMSHLHKDHAGGICVEDEIGQRSLSFTNAQYYLQHQELDYAFEVGAPSYYTEELALLKNNPAVTLLKGGGTIDDYIHYDISGGHCPFHQIFRIEEDDQIVFFGGDVAPQLQQMKSRLVAKYDYNGRQSMELRQLWWQMGQQHDWTFLFYHDIKNPFWPAEES